MEKYKDRLVVCGNEEDDSDSETFSVVSEYTVTKILFHLAVKRD